MISFGISSQESKATGLDYLLGLVGNMTLHAPDGTRLIGFDNAHGGIKPEGSRFLHAGKKYPYDHKHRHVTDGGVLYEFDTAYQLVSDFYADVDRVLKEVSR